ncbi:MAG: MFS transporter [Anaerolineae bacterium]|jgi:UMF1 family MFS transporter|nr:MFS transporter [Chloroflexota bacterium]
MAARTESDRLHRRAINSWCLYDWANSAFATTIMAALLPPYFSTVAAASLEPSKASAIWGYAVSISMLFTALIGPIMGAAADYSGRKKRYMGGFLVLAILFTGCLYLVQRGDWLQAVVFYVLASIGNAGANVFYDSLLPHVARQDEIDRVSAKGFALGYLGGGILLLINLIWYMKPAWFGFADSSVAVRASFLSVAVWWVVFAIPIFRNVPEPAGAAVTAERRSVVRTAFQRVGETFREIRQYGELFKFLLAFWLYADGIGTIIRMATIYGAEIGIGTVDLAGALLLTQVVAFPMTLLFGRLAGRVGAKSAIYVALGVYTIISILGYFMSAPWHFWVLAGMVGTVQGGSQALSRSLFGSMCPRNRSAEFFGFYDISSKFAGIAGPLLFGLTASLAGTSRWAIVSLIIFFVVGALLLSRVDVDRGRAVARAVEQNAGE